MVFNKHDRDEIVNYVLSEIDNMCSHKYETSKFISTKSIGDVGDKSVVPFIDTDRKKKGKLGSYKVPLLPKDPETIAHKYALKGVDNSHDYYMRCLPATVQLAERMRWRGKRVDQGSRVEYVISRMGGHKAKMFIKVEDAEYFSNHASSLKLDYMAYIKLMANPFDDVLNIMYDTENSNSSHKYMYKKSPVLSQYKYRLRVRGKMLTQLVGLSAPEVELIE
jgi:hypothetical protein